MQMYISEVVILIILFFNFFVGFRVVVLYALYVYIST